MILSFYVVCHFVFICWKHEVSSAVAEAFVDDSYSMTQAKRRVALEDTLQHVAKFATKLEPSGISIRFLNFSQDREFNNLNDVEDIMRKVRAVDFDGPTRLGQTLHFKIVGPMVFQKERRNTFTKPIIVMVITDGEVSMTNYLGCYGGIKCAVWTEIFTLTNLS
jgi:hypothetical protein